MVRCLCDPGSMARTTQRVLRLLSLLESRPVWGGPELADRLGVTERTVRRDVDRLRELGYPVEAERGAGGGYRLGAGPVSYTHLVVYKRQSYCSSSWASACAAVPA